ncbi:MAG: hypothetical protein CME65_05415 [Halobacteriovoraceae bacterium]|nr:hypothetical protein [Halobacteriovoraceae bacterium]|tara:strand:+ start:10758 stop:11639 length:882 start_codon:yes stop_codon:yes gene_type:complete
MLAFGGASLSGKGGGYGFGEVDNRQELLEFALDFGIKLYDSAPIYGFGESERFLGQFFEKIRDKVQIVSKAGVSWHPSKRVNMSNDPQLIQKMLDQSLRDLRSDYIDIYMIHWPDPNVDIRYSVEVLAKAQSLGKIKHIGLCNTNNEEIALASEVARIEYLQSECNLFHNAFETVNDDGAKTMAWGVFDKGILAGSVNLDRKFDDSDCRSWAPWWKKSGWQKKVEYRDRFEFSEELQELSLHFALNVVDFVLIGAKSIQQLEEVIKLKNRKIDTERIQEARDYFSRYSLEKNK